MAYDKLHRLTATTYPSGSYASVTPAKHFVYDSATVNSVSMVLVAARLAEAYTCSGSCTSKITDEGFSYTKRGETSDLYQSNPSSGGFYHVAQTYWANGAVNKLSGIPGLPTITYNVDGEGRIKTASASSGQNPLTATGYNYAGSATSVTFGSGDSDGFTYDGNTNRMTKYQFNVNGQTETGQLTWNQMGTLGKLQITDPFNSTDNGQSCTYSHDDLVRVSGVNCGSLWTQTFSYDAYGNLAKSGTGTFAATYTGNNNRISTIASFTPTYDANGNLLQDTYNTYTWDADGNLVSVVGKTVTYDAFDRMVAFSNGQTYIYAPSGGSPLTQGVGQTLGLAYLHLPANAVVVYNSSGILQYNHPDWLGSARLLSTQTRGTSPGYAYAPFGEGYARASGGWAQFTTDGNVWTANYGSNMGGTLDDFEFRRYSPSQGRWISPDPAGSAAVDPTNPQSWNRYAYVTNNPLANVDPTGLDNCNVFNVSWEGSGDPFPCGGDASTHTTQPAESPTSIAGPIGVAVGSMIGSDSGTASPEGFPTGSPFGAQQRIGVPIFTGLNNPDGTPMMDTWYGSAGPTGLANVPSIVGTQIGDDLKTIPAWYFNAVKGNSTTVVTILYADQPGTLTISQQGVWALTSSAFGLQDYASMSFPNLNLANQDSGSCATAAQKIAKFIASHPGIPIPVSLTSAMGPACSGL